MPSVNVENTEEIPSCTKNTGDAAHMDLKPGNTMLFTCSIVFFASNRVVIVVILVAKM